MKKAVRLYKFKPAKGLYAFAGSLCFALLLSLQSCSPKISEKGKASFYADFFQGRKTSNGEVFRQRKRTAAHKTLPFGLK